MDHKTSPPQKRTKRIVGCLFNMISTMLLCLILTPVVLLALIFIQPSTSVIKIPYLKSYLSKMTNYTIEDHNIQYGRIGVTRGKSFFNPKIIIKDIILHQHLGAPVFSMPELSIDSSIITGIHFNKKDAVLHIQQPRFYLWRSKKGKLNLAQSEKTNINFLTQIERTLDQFFNLPIAKNIATLKMEEASLNYIDIHKNQRHALQKGTIEIRRDTKAIQLISNFQIDRLGLKPSFVQFSAQRTLGQSLTDITLKFDSIDPLSLADQIPALDWLRNIDASVNASMMLQIGENGTMKSIKGVLDLGAGFIHETPQNAPATYKKAKIYYTYDVKTDYFNIDDLTLDTNWGRINGIANLQFIRDKKRIISGINARINIENATIAKTDFFEQEIEFKNGITDAIITFSPFSVSFTNLTIEQDDTILTAEGNITANDIWQANGNLAINQFTAQHLKEKWPLSFAPNARSWVSENLYNGILYNVKGPFDLKNGQSTFNFHFDFDHINTHLIKTLNPLKNGKGHGRLTQNTLTLKLDSGIIIPTGQNPIKMNGSRFFIHNIGKKSPTGHIKLQLNSDFQSILHIINDKKNNLFTDIKKIPPISSKNVDITGSIIMPFRHDSKSSEILFDFSGSASNVTSNKLIKNKTIKAEKVTLSVNNQNIKIHGSARLDTLPLKYHWQQNFTNNPDKISTVLAEFKTNKEILQKLNIALPDTTFKGETTTKIQIKIKNDSSAHYILTSDLKGAEIESTSLGWRKNAKQLSTVKLNGTISDTISINNFEINSNALSAQGHLAMDPTGRISKAEFSTLKVKDFLSIAPIVTYGKENTTFDINGGYFDIRKGSFTTINNKKTGLLNIYLDELRISDNIALTKFYGKIISNGSMRGTFYAQINDGAYIEGKIEPSKYGHKITIKAKDAGKVARAAKIINNFTKGDLEFIFYNTQEKGVYKGTFNIKNIRMHHSSYIATIFDNLSLVGLLQKLDGSGIHFNMAKGNFTITPQKLELHDLIFVGNSLGITLDGWLNKIDQNLNFQGMITPVYVINGTLRTVFGKLFGNREGEGLFSFMYKIEGNPDNPKIIINPLSILTPGIFRKIFNFDIKK